MFSQSMEKIMIDYYHVDTFEEAKRKLVEFSTNYMSQFVKSINQLQETYENPNSLFSSFKYKESLKNFYWSMLYGLKKEELFEIIKTINSEAEFDNYMEIYFTEEKMSLMFDELLYQTREPQKLILEQSIFAFKHEQYALSNMGILSLIDYSLSFLLRDKMETKRKGILDLVMSELTNLQIRKIDLSYYLLVATLSNNIDRVFEPNRITNPVIEGNKQARRHPSQHGFGFSNKKVDTLMLFNILYNIYLLRPYLSDFENKLYRPKIEGKKIPEFKIKKDHKNK